MSEIRSKLLAKNRKTLKSAAVEVDGEPITVQIIKPTLGERLRVIESAQNAGEVDAEGKPTSPFNGARVTARMICTCMYLDGQPLFRADDHEEVLVAPWFEEVAPLVGEAFTPDEEALRKNS